MAASAQDLSCLVLYSDLHASSLMVGTIKYVTMAKTVGKYCPGVSDAFKVQHLSAVIDDRYNYLGSTDVSC
jgi:hypothetical protein